MEPAPAAIQARSNETAPAAPSPVPPSQAITTEPVPAATPELVPSVVEISTVGPNSTFPSNGTSTVAPDGEDEESDEEGSEEDEEGEENVRDWSFVYTG